MNYAAVINTVILILGVPLLYVLSDTFQAKRAARRFYSAHAEYSHGDEVA